MSQGGCVLIALPADAPPEAKGRYLQCLTCSALVSIAATAHLEPDRCPPSAGQVAAGG